MMDSKIKPIDTYYNGRKFRSRCEARWGVFFSAMGITWDYEVEGFEVNGMRYLPDFWIKDWNTFIEIKPCFDENDPATARALIIQDLWMHNDPQKRTLWIICGTPFFREYFILVNIIERLVFAECRYSERDKCKGLYMQDIELNCYGAIGSNHTEKCIQDNDHEGLIDGPNILNAYNQACQARFEFGEHGT